MNLLPSLFWLDAITGIKLQMRCRGESRLVHPHASGELYQAQLCPTDYSRVI